MRPIAPPPPEVITQLSELVQLVLNIEAVSKTVAELKAASEEYQEAKLDYEVAISKATLAQQALEAQKAETEPAIAEAAAKADEARLAIAELAQARADLQAGFANLESRTAEIDAREKALAAAEAERLAELDKQIEQARAATADAEAMKATIAAKLAILKE